MGDAATAAAAAAAGHRCGLGDDGWPRAEGSGERPPRTRVALSSRVLSNQLRRRRHDALSETTREAARVGHESAASRPQRADTARRSGARRLSRPFSPVHKRAPDAADQTQAADRHRASRRRAETDVTAPDQSHRSPLRQNCLLPPAGPRDRTASSQPLATHRPRARFKDR